METTENNKLIAEFMDYPDLGTEGDFSYLKYHKSWDWLMPVIDKCYQEHMGKHIEEAVMTYEIRKAYQVVIEYLKEYNKQNSNDMKLFLKAHRCPSFDYPKDELPYAVVFDWHDKDGYYQEQGDDWKYFESDEEANKFCKEYNKQN